MRNLDFLANSDGRKGELIGELKGELKGTILKRDFFECEKDDKKRKDGRRVIYHIFLGMCILKRWKWS